MVKDQVQDEMKAAMRAQDKERLAVIRLILSEIKRIEKDELKTLNNTEELAILDRMQKQRRESIAQFKAAGREDLVKQEEFEIVVIQSFKPAALSEQEVHQLVADAIKETQASGIQDMAKVMTILKPKLQGRADMGQVSAQVKALLTA